MYLNAGLKRTIEKLANQASKATFKMKSLQNKYIFLDNNRPDNVVTILNSECKRTLDNLAIYIRKAQAIHQQVAEAWLELEMNELVDLRIIVTWFIEWYLFI